MMAASLGWKVPLARRKCCLWTVRNQLLDNADVFLIGHHPHVLHGADGLETVDGELDK